MKLVTQLWNYYLDEKSFLRSFSSHLALTFLSGFFPLLIIIVAIVGLVVDREVIFSGSLDAFFTLWPRQIVDLLEGVIFDITGSVGFAVFSFGFLFLFIAVDTMFRDMMFVLNYIYGYTEHRSLIRRVLLSLLLCVLGVVFVLVLTLFLFLSHQFVIWISTYLVDVTWLENLLSWRLPLALMVTTILTFGAYYFLPAHDSFRWKKVLPGTIFFTLLFLLFGWGFNYYLTEFAAYNTTYGVLGAIVLLLVYLKLSALFFIFGAVINSFYTE